MIITTIAIILLVLWVLGLLAGVILGGYVHILLVAAIVLFLVRIFRGKEKMIMK